MGLVYLPTFSQKNQPNVCELITTHGSLILECYLWFTRMWGSPSPSQAPSQAKRPRIESC